MSSSSLLRKSHIATQLSLYKGYKRKVSYSHYSHIQSYSIFNRINASGFSVPQVHFVRVLMFVQHTDPTHYAKYDMIIGLIECRN
jgi:hypothetical protein